MFLSPLRREGGGPKSSSSNGTSGDPGSWFPGCGTGGVNHTLGFPAARPVDTGESRETGGSPASATSGDALAVLGGVADRCGSPLPRIVRGAWAVVDPPSPDSELASVTSAARLAPAGMVASTSGEASANVAAWCFKVSRLLTTLGSSLISQPERRRLPTRGRASPAVIIDATTDWPSPARYRLNQMPRQPLPFVAPGELPHAVERGLLSRIVGPRSCNRQLGLQSSPLTPHIPQTCLLESTGCAHRLKRSLPKPRRLTARR
jgi:hypothetical protein